MRPTTADVTDSGEVSRDSVVSNTGKRSEESS